MRKTDLSGVEKGGDRRHKFVQTLLSAPDHMLLTLAAMERDTTLAKLLEEIIHNFLIKEKET